MIKSIKSHEPNVHGVKLHGCTIGDRALIGTVVPPNMKRCIKYAEEYPLQYMV